MSDFFKPVSVIQTGFYADISVDEFVCFFLIFNQGKPVSKRCYQGVPWTTKNKIKITFKVLKALQNEVRDIYSNKKFQEFSI